VADIVNLRLARKAKARTTKDAEASANRAAFGRTKAERDATARTQAARDRTLDGAKRDT
jgi:hypothetical protein